MKLIKKPEQALTLGYVVTLCAIAIFAGLAVYIQNTYIAVEEKGANAMATIAQQQIRVQEIALAAGSLARSNKPPMPIRERLLALAKETEEKHIFLLDVFQNRDGFFWDLEDSTLLSEKDIQSYQNLDAQIKSYLDHTRKIASGENTDIDQLLISVEEANTGIVRILADIQDSYASERKAKVASYKTVQILGYLLIVGVILLAGIFIFRPITNHVRAARLELEKAQKSSERASRIKTEFLTNISHEIRTPLGGILGFTDMMLCDPECSGERRSNVFSIKRSAKHLKTLIDDILDLSKVEAGTIEVSREEFSLIGLIHEVVSIIEVKMQDKGLSFSVRFQSEIPEFIVSDPMRITQILVNVLGNAVKFTDEGSVVLQVSASKKSNNAELVFSVIDTGCGIAPEKTKKLFRRFSQVDSSLSRKTEGTGLGLALSKHLANLIDGDLVLQKSTPGKGSTFQFTLQCVVPEGTKAISEFSATKSDDDDAVDPKDLEGALTGVRILLVEDGHDNQRVYNYFLKLAGAEVHPCWDGLSGLEYGSTHDDIDVILMDIQLPKMDGYTVTNELRIRGVKKPIVALTAHAMQDEKEKCLKSGFSDYVSKPVSIPTLIRTVKKHATTRITNQMKPEPNEAIKSKYHDKKVYQPMILEFVDTLTDRVEAIAQKAEDEDWVAVKKAAHKVKGAASTYGYPEITNQAGAIEEKASSIKTTNCSTDTFYVQLERFKATCQRAIAGAKELRTTES